MGMIDNVVWEMRRLLEETELQTDEKLEELVELQVSLTEESYKKGLVKNLINTNRHRAETLYIGNYEWVEDYEILTGSRMSEDGEEFTNEEDYNRHIEKLVEERLNTYVTKADEDIEGCFIILDEEGDIYDDGIESHDLESTLKSIKEELEYDYEDFEDLELEYDEICFNYVYNYDYIDIELAQKCGLGVLEMNDGDQYLFLTGGGMDMSFQFVQYEALYFGSISEDYVDKLGWTKQNVSKEDYNQILESLGVDLERLNIN